MGTKSTIQELADLGQSVWLDYISRSLLAYGKLQKLIDLGLRGMTSNPTIFDKAISSSSDYDEDIIRLKSQGKSGFEIYDELTIGDIQKAADIFLPVYEKTDFMDGYVSLEIDPRLAMKAKESIEEGVRLFQKVNRPNLMIKVPATKAGFQVTEELLAMGINVNVTLIFSVEQYIQTVWAYLKGMNRLSNQKKNLRKTRSVASVFVSRIDTTIDNLLNEKISQETNDIKKNELKRLLGRAAVANSRFIFERFQVMSSSDLFKSLVKKGLSPQRVLWASTGTKNPNYSDIKYVTELIASPTVNTLPEETIHAFLDHGFSQEAFGKHSVIWDNPLKPLNEFGIDINQICTKLLMDGLVSFEKSFDSLLNSVASKSQTLCVS